MSSKTLVGQTFGKYQVVEALGRGGMAEVYRAYQENLDRDVAIKVMHSFLADEEGFLTRFKREAKAMAALNHRNIVSVYDFDVQDGMYYIVMEFVSGGTLKQKLEDAAKNNESLRLSTTVQFVLEIASALSYAHRRGMVHRDIKPGNIMIDEQGHAILTDFGIAKILSGPSFTATGAMIGTPAYMSPEQGLGQAGDERSDIYALGVLFYQMATGRLPYDADTPLAVILKHVNEPLPEPSKIVTDLPEPIEAVMLKSLAKDPDERYQTAQDMASALRQAADESDMDISIIIPFIAAADTTSPPVTAMGTPPPSAAEPAPATVVSPDVSPSPSKVSTPPPPADATRVASSEVFDATEVAAPMPPIAPTPPSMTTAQLAPTPKPAAEEKEPEKKKGIPWVIIVAIILLLVIVLGGGGLLASGILGGGSDTPEPTEVVAVVPEEDTPEPTEEPTIEPEATGDTAATAVAAVAATLTAEAPVEESATPEEEVEETPDATATFLASCEPDLELVNAYSFRTQNSSSAPIGVVFPMNWVLRNNGNCPLLAGLKWSYLEGEEFGEGGSIELETDLEPGEERTLTLDLEAPARTGTYESTWQLVDADGNAIGDALTFEVLVYVPATATPVASPTPEATATASRAFGYDRSVASCSYVESDWKCTLFMTPYGGVGPYTFITDESPTPEYKGTGPFSHTIVSPRCSPWVHTITVTDDGTGETKSEAIFIDPNAFFAGGCVMPEPGG